VYNENTIGVKRFLWIFHIFLDLHVNFPDNKDMEPIHQRIIVLRGHLSLNQSQFAKKIGVTSTHINKVEAGKAKLSETAIRYICLTFGVNEYWLRNGGNGPIFKDSPILTPEEEELLAVYEKLEPDRKKELQEYAKERLELQEHKKLLNQHWKAGLEGKRLETVEILDEDWQESPEN